MPKRFIEPDKIPKTLWLADDEMLQLPIELVTLWKWLLKENNLLHKASFEKAPEGFVGGMSEKDTKDHLAWRYNGSCARVLLSVLDPKQNLSAVSDAYANTFAGEKVFLADLPSGSGAATMTILCTLHELRKQGVLPRHPLELIIVAGELSPTARSLFEDQLIKLKPILKTQTISVEHQIVSWNAIEKVSTVDLTKVINIQSKDATAKFVIVSNFSGLLKQSSKWKAAQPHFEDIFLHSRECTAIWLEPQTNSAADFFLKLTQWFKNTFKKLLDTSSFPSKCYAASSSPCKQPIKDGHFDVHLSVVRFDLPQEMIQ